LNLTAINLPKGEQRRRSEDDVMQMRTFFEENDLLSGEIQQIHHDGGVNIQTRNLKYGKLKNGILVQVNHNLIKKKKFHFIDIIPDIKAIIGMNGLIWVYYSTVKLESDYFTDDQTKVNTLNKIETPNEFAAINIILVKNIIKSLENNKILIDAFTIGKFYEIYIEIIEKEKTSQENLKNLSEQEFLKRRIVIKKNIEDEVINRLKFLLASEGKNKKDLVDLGKQVETMKKMMEEVADEDEMEY